jgi:hypothetical protein
MILKSGDIDIISSERELAVQVELSELKSLVKRENQENETVDVTQQLDRLRDEILEKVENTLQKTPELTPHEDPTSEAAAVQTNHKIKEDLDEQLRQIKAMRARLNTILEGNEPSPEVRILKQVYFDSMYVRENALERVPAEAGTFEWILDESEEPLLKMDIKSREDCSDAKDRFLRWLRNDNGVFHISGKAGSGKSTLMKLLLNHDKTKELLNDWAGDKKLIFAYFFFWKSSQDHNQCSLEGLYRSILFETLLQCPDLTREVFKKAYNTFLRKKSTNSMDKLVFRPGDFEKAFEILVSTSPPSSDYRICLFIDGLDEYVGDDINSLEHQKLADNLNKWASHENIKILASSRPDRAFEETFSGDFRIRLHKLTTQDITVIGYAMFEKHKAFKNNAEVRSRYKELVELVVWLSRGVILWARMAICTLLNAIGRDTPIDKAVKKLWTAKGDINKLYEGMFKSISPDDLDEACKLLLLCAENKRHDLNALSIKWLDEMEDSDFPAKCEMRPYTDEEINRGHLMAERQLADLTMGLLEVVERLYSSMQEDPYFGKRIVFFHRTARDFVRSSEMIRKFSAKLPNFTKKDTYSRLLLAELWFANSKSITGHATVYKNILLHDELSYQGPRAYPLAAYERAFAHHNEIHLEFPNKTREYIFNGQSSKPLETYMPTIEEVPMSFLHFVARYGGPRDVGYVESAVKSTLEFLKPQGELSLLLSAAASGWTDPTMTRALLNAGVSPHDKVRVRRDGFLEHTVWQIFCAFFAARMVSRAKPHREYFLQRDCECFEYFLIAGVDPNCFILLAQTDVGNAREFRSEEPATHIISLKDLVKQLKPPNFESLFKLMENCDQGFLQNPGMVCESSTEAFHFEPRDYLPFTIDMQQRTPEDRHFEPDFPKDNEKRSWFIVHSIVWKNARVFVPDMEIRIC